MISEPTSYRSWSSPVPHNLDDIAGCIKDMFEAKSCLELLLKITSESPDATVANALSTSAVIHYCRCFVSGNRQRLDITTLTTSNDVEKSMHEYIQRVRNRHIAHPVNQQEVHDLQLIIGDGLASQKIILGMSSLYVASSPLSRDLVPVALSLINKWLKLLAEKQVAEVIRLKPHAETLSQTQLLALPMLAPVPNDNVDAKRKQNHHK